MYIQASHPLDMRVRVAGFSRSNSYPRDPFDPLRGTPYTKRFSALHLTILREVFLSLRCKGSSFGGSLFRQSSSRRPLFRGSLLVAMIGLLGPFCAAENTSQITLDTSETLFAVLTAINTCGYDQDLNGSDAMRSNIRAQEQKNLQASEEAQGT